MSSFDDLLAQSAFEPCYTRVFSAQIVVKLRPLTIKQLQDHPGAGVILSTKADYSDISARRVLRLAGLSFFKSALIRKRCLPALIAAISKQTYPDAVKESNRKDIDPDDAAERLKRALSGAGIDANISADSIQKTQESAKKAREKDTVALVEFLMKEYGWEPVAILQLTPRQIAAIATAAADRYEKQAEAIENVGK